jgi:hypothetical protein
MSKQVLYGGAAEELEISKQATRTQKFCWKI